MCENYEGQPLQDNPLQSDKRQGDSKLPHSVLVISSNIDKEDECQEPKSLTKESGENHYIFESALTVEIFGLVTKENQD